MIRAAARLYATGGNAAIYYGLGVTEHSQGTTTVIAIANLAMATGNIGRRGVGVNPLRGQNNVQGSCDMGSFPHEFTNYRHVSDDTTRKMFEDVWGVPLEKEPGLRIPNMIDAAMDGTFKGIYIQGEDILQSDPDTHHMAGGLAAMECVVVQDLFLNETANYAHVFLPGCTFLEKDGTFTNAERRVQLIRKVMSPKNGYGDWEITMLLSNALGYPMHYNHPSEIMDEIAATSPGFTNISFKHLDEVGSVQWPCNDKAPEGTPIMHIGPSRAARASSSSPNMCRPTRRRGRVSRCFSPPAAFSASTMSARRRGAPPIRSGMKRMCSKSIRMTPRQRGVRDGDWVKLQSRTGDTTLRAKVTDRVAPGVVYTTFHHPSTQANVVTTDFSDWATNCPEYKVTAVQISTSNGPSDWQERYRELTEQSRRIAAKIEAAE